ncbi:MAG: peptidylprolyl isomerase [Saprospiraceae bacterium]|nr:peptidylprolyl isomerase [Saprospiraceae bacterium]
MALIGKIRKSMWLIVILIALGVGGFILQDMMSGQQSLFGGAQTSIGKVNGETIDWNDFATTDNIIESVLFQNQSREVYSRRQVLWDYFVEEILLKKEAERLGLGVSRTELLDLEFGVNPSPIIRQRFVDPNTGQINRQRLTEFKTAIEGNQLTDPMIRAYWAHQEKEIIKDRLESKLVGMIAQAIYTPTWMAEMGHREQNERVDFAYVRVPFDELDNSEVTLEDKDYEAYLKENAERFRQKEETRLVKYLTLEVFPTAGDSLKIREQVDTLIPQFQETTEDSIFVTRYFGAYDPAYFKKADLSPVIADTVFQLPLGTVYGPYIDGGAYQAVKVLDRKVVPDSVRSRHILIPATDAATLAAAQSRVDSLKGLIEAGTNSFDTLALAFGTDASRTKGGDLDWAAPGTMVKPFNDLIFYEAEPGKLYKVLTQFGVHLVEVTDRKFINNEQGVKLAYLRQAIVPSQQTQDSIYERALNIASNNRTLEKLEQTVKGNQNLSLETSPLLKRNDYAIGTALEPGQTSRDIIRWAFEAKKGNVSPDVFIYQDQVELYNRMYVIAALSATQKAGIPSLENIKADIEQQVINKKKGELLVAKMKGKGLDALATEYTTTIDTAQNIGLGTPMVPDVGSEPKVIAEALKLTQGQSSPPIVGNTGVYVLNIIAKTESVPAADLTPVRNSMAAAVRNQIPPRLMETMKKNAKIKDNRFTFY